MKYRRPQSIGLENNMLKNQQNILNRNHVMLDFETLGTSANCVVASLGAVVFNHDKILLEKEWHFDLDEQLRLGRKVSGGTIKWWMKQSDESRKKTFLQPWVCGINQLFDDINSDLAIYNPCPWGNGADFDLPILQSLHAQHKGNFLLPWKYTDHMCFRTFDAITGAKTLVKRDYSKHHCALDDAKYQAQCTLEVFKQWQQTTMI